jgi:hypothetical protein
MKQLLGNINNFLKKRDFNFPTVLCGEVSGTGTTMGTGVSKVDSINYTGDSGDINSELSYVADISAPSSWTTLVSVAYKCSVQIADVSSDFVSFAIGSAEPAGAGLAVKVVRDGVTIWSAYGADDGIAEQKWGKCYPTMCDDAALTKPIKCKSSFGIYATRTDYTFSGSASFVRMGALYVTKY